MDVGENRPTRASVEKRTLNRRWWWFNEASATVPYQSNFNSLNKLTDIICIIEKTTAKTEQNKT